MRRLLAAATTIALVAVGAAATEARATRPGDSMIKRAGDPTLRWEPCTDATLKAFKAECGVVTVPMDYKKPDGEKIELAISRIKHTVPEAKYQGIMLVNPGGPGGPGRTLSVLGSLVPKGAGAAYDWIGFDPRGVGASKPALTCDSDYKSYKRPDYVPRTTELEKVWLRRTEAYARACAKAGGELLEHLTTLDSARDMDSIRLVLGARQLSYYGFSYGTYLGQVYATLHPDRVRRMVLDGNVNPSRVWYDSNLDQDAAFDKNINIYFAWLAENHKVFKVGKTAKEVSRRYYAELTKLARKPAGGAIGPAELTDVFLQAGYYVFSWAAIGQAYSAWVNKKDPKPLKNLFDKDNPQTEGADNGYAIYLGVECTDAPWPASWTKWTSDNWQVHRKAPFETWANAWYNAPCRTWGAKAGVPATVSGETVAPLLLISETNDAATPFTGSLEVRKRFPKSSLIEGVGGTTHSGSLFGNQCVDVAIADYLASGVLPKRLKGERSDKRCSPLPPPPAERIPPAPVARQADAHHLRSELQRLTTIR